MVFLYANNFISFLIVKKLIVYSSKQIGLYFLSMNILFFYPYFFIGILNKVLGHIKVLAQFYCKVIQSITEFFNCVMVFFRVQSITMTNNCSISYNYLKDNLKERLMARRLILSNLYLRKK